MKKWLAGTVEGVFDALQYSIVPKWRMPNLPLAGHLRSLFAAYAVDGVIDVGANDGGFAKFLRQEVGFSGAIFSFEPTHAAFAQLADAARTDPAWHVHDVALGEENRTQAINVTQDDKFSSFLAPAAVQDLRQKRNAVAGRQEVTLARLEDWAAANLGDPCQGRFYLKIDTQGYDLHVLRGCGRFLDNVVCAQSEVPFQKIYDGIEDYWDILRTWNMAGFDVSGMFATNRDSLQRAIEFDCVMINRNAPAARGGARSEQNS